MKKVIFALLVTMSLAACGEKKSNQADVDAPFSVEQEGVEVLYFHGKQRCITCNVIESLTKEVLEENFMEQLESGKILFKSVDISTPDGELLADKYEVTWSSLYINGWHLGAENRNNLTDFAFSYAKNSPDQFKEGIKKRIEELLHL
ncbi:MAG: nitrophenyl compound nitroreductase subunit ArsF family protein [Phocaeicola sp.]